MSQKKAKSKKRGIEQLIDGEYHNNEPPLKKARISSSSSNVEKKPNKLCPYTFSHKTQKNVFEALTSLEEYKFVEDVNIFYLITLYSTGIFAHCFRSKCDKEFIVYDLKETNILINNEYYIMDKDEFTHSGDCLLCGYHGNEWGYCSKHYSGARIPDFMGVIQDYDVKLRTRTDKIIICKMDLELSKNPCCECPALIPESQKLILCGKCHYGPFCRDCASKASNSQDYCFRANAIFCCTECLENLSEGEKEW